jgi:hypothetical protein
MLSTNSANVMLSDQTKSRENSLDFATWALFITNIDFIKKNKGNWKLKKSWIKGDLILFKALLV